MVRIEFNRLRFLIVDDNAHMRRIVRTLLHGFGTREVYEAEDGAGGLEAFTHYSPDIVICDWAMPIFDGLELAQMIRQPDGGTNPYVPIIMLTGHSEKKRVVAARDAGISATVCGEMAGDALVAPILLGLGITELSMSAVSIPEVKAVVRTMSVEEARALVERVRDLPTAADVRSAVLAYLNDLAPPPKPAGAA